MSKFLNTRHQAFRTLSWMMTILTVLAPFQVLAEQPLKLQYLAPGSAAVLAARPQQLLTCEVAKMLPVEVVSAVALKELGFDPLDITQIVISVTPPLMGPPLYSAAVTFDRPIDISTLSQQLIGHTKATEQNGKTYLRSQNPLLPSFGWADDHTLLIAPEITLQNLLQQQKPTKNPLAEKVTALGGHDDLLMVVDLEALRGLIQMGLAQAASEAPPEVQPFLTLPTLLKSVHLRANLSGSGPWELAAQANNSADADRVAELLDQALQIYDEKMGELTNKMLLSEDPVEQAMGKYLTRISPQWAEQMKPTRDGDQFTVFYVDPNDQNAGLTSITVIGTLVGLLLPAVQAAREAARRNSSINNMKNIGLAILNYADRHRSFPAHANYSAAGKPLLSWRVLILPELDETALYNQFHLDEPWDSEHNRQLISKMPALFLDPSSVHSLAEGKTHYLGAKGEGFVFDGTAKGKNFAGIRDGTSNTIMILQVNDRRVATWTKPEDWELDPKAPLKGLAGGMHPGIFLASFCDAHVKAISEAIDPEVFQHLLTISGGEIVNLLNP